MRGKAAKQAVLIKAYGITPACAGKRAGCTIARPPSWDHPRVCGEKVFAVLCAASAVGSPPRVRGKATKSEKLRRDMRITPACAGKRYTSETNRLTMWDHPRVCGEKADKRVHAPAAAGSPPRVRGKADAVADVVQAIRITPACAGKRVVYQPRRKPRRDHPRVCGEKTKESLKK